MVSVIASSALDHGFKCWSDQTEDYEIGFPCFSTKHAALKTMGKDRMARNQNNVSEWGNMSTVVSVS